MEILTNNMGSVPGFRECCLGQIEQYEQTAS